MKRPGTTFAEYAATRKELETGGLVRLRQDLRVPAEETLPKPVINR